MAETLRSLSRMLRSVMEREDIVLFPAFKLLMPTSEYHDPGEAFEEREHRLSVTSGMWIRYGEYMRLKEA